MSEGRYSNRLVLNTITFAWVALLSLTSACSTDEPKESGVSDAFIDSRSDATPATGFDAMSEEPDSEVLNDTAIGPMPQSDASVVDSDVGTPRVDGSMPDVGPPVANCEVNEVIERNGCLSCHGQRADLNGGGLNLSPDRMEESLVNVASRSPGCADTFLVNPSHPEASVLLHTLAPDEYRGSVEPHCHPMSMPLGGGTSVNFEDVQCLEQWIRTLEQPEVQPSEVTYEAPAFTVLTRIKYLLDGGALTGEEVERGSSADGSLDQDGLEALIEIWMSGDRFHQKRRQFLELHLQQTPSDINYFNQFRNTRTNSLAPVREALNQSLIRTAERIIDEDGDFRTIVTTNTWEVTTLTLLALKMADNPMILRSNCVWPKNNAINDIRFVMNQPDLYDASVDGQDWRTVTLVHNPDSTDMATEAEILDSLNAERLRTVPDGGSIELRTPRIGFFTSPAFFQTWQTNRDNDFRVTINQALIVATGLSFTPGDNTPLTGDQSAVDLELFPRDSTCYGCHKNLDTMRTAFLTHYDNINTRYNPSQSSLPRPGFSFQRQSAEIDGIHDWAQTLATHPNFALAWVLKLCQWASSIECSATDPTILDLSQRFVESGYNLRQLFAMFFSSPLTTHTSNNEGTVVPGAQVSVARFGHYCHAMRARLSDIRVAQGYRALLPDRLDVCSENGPGAPESLPKGRYVRSDAALHQPRDYTPMVSIAFEGLCAVSAPKVVEAHGRAAFHPQDPGLALN